MSEQAINRVLVSGRLVSDPDLHELLDGTPVCALRLASATKRRTPSVSRSAANEFSVLVLGPKARRIAPYLYLGRQVIVQGCLGAERRGQGEGAERKAVCVIAERISFVGAPPIGAGSGREWAKEVATGMSAAVGFSEDIWR